jgi:hypothetical protein
VSRAVLDDHLLRDLLADRTNESLGRVLAIHEPATTNLYYVRLCRSVVSARGGRLTGSWPADERRALGRTLVALPASVDVVPMRMLAFPMAELTDRYPVSTLGAEAVAAAVHLGGPLCVWEGDDGPAIRDTARAAGVDYQALAR